MKRTLLSFKCLIATMFVNAQTILYDLSILVRSPIETAAVEVNNCIDAFVTKKHIVIKLNTITLSKLQMNCIS